MCKRVTCQWARCWLSQTRTELRAQYIELERDTIDIYKCISDVTGAVTSAPIPLPPQPHEQLEGQRTLEGWWKKDVEPETPVLLPVLSTYSHFHYSFCGGYEYRVP